MTPDACPDPDRPRLAEICRAMVREREIMRNTVGRTLHTKAHWDMLLALFLSHHEDRSMMVTALCAASHVPEATAYRKIADLKQHGLLARDDDLLDRRRVEVALTDEGMVLLTRMFARLDRLFAVSVP